jgi:hypothetical protein
MAHVARVATTQGVGCLSSGFQDAIAILDDGNEASLFEPAKSKRQLPQVVSGVADRKLPGPPQGVCGLPSDRRLCRVQLLLTDASRSPSHGAIKIPRRLTRLSGIGLYIGFWEKTVERWNGGPRNESTVASGSSPQSPTGRNPPRVDGSSFQQAGAV